MMYEMDRQGADQRKLDATFIEWRKSSFSNPPDNQCVEVAFSTNAVGVRDSKKPGGTPLVFGQNIWPAFLARCATDDFGPPQAQ